VDAVEQFQVVTSGGQAELGRALGGYVSVVTRAAPTRCTARLRLLPRRRLNAANALSGTRLPMYQTQSGGSLGGPLRANRTFYFATSSSACWIRPGCVTIARPTRRHQRRLAQSATRARRRTGLYRHPWHSATCSARSIIRSAVAAAHASATACTTSTDARAGAGASQRALAAAGLDNRDHPWPFGNTLDLVADHRQRDARAGRARRLAGAARRRLGPAVSIAGVAMFGTLSWSPTRRQNSLYQVVDNLSHQAGAHALRAGWTFVVNDDTITYPRVGARELHVLDARELPGRHLHAGSRRPSAIPSCRRPAPRRRLRAGRVARGRG
jgi:hypothetical protein